MKILWVCNLPTPKIAADLGSNSYHGGGWLISLLDGLAKMEDLDVTMCFPDNTIEKTIKGRTDNIDWFAFPVRKKASRKPITYITKPNPVLIESIKKIVESTKPDILHVFGTEIIHSSIAVDVFAKPEKTIVHIQGLLTYYLKHYFAGIPGFVKYRIGLAELIKGSIYKQFRNMQKRRFFEKKILNKVNNIAGRTDWDHSAAIFLCNNPKYHYYGEILRESFYRNIWNIDTCEKYSIFFSSGTVPLKGFHYMLETMKYIVQFFPEAKLYVAGNIPRKLKYKNVTIPPLKTSYFKYIEHLIKKFKLTKNVVFTSSLTEEKMCSMFLKSHVFVCASSIENSSNSIGEAMLLGVPSVVSDVGGVKNLMKHGEEGYIYPCDEPYMAAYYIKKIFDDDVTAVEISKNSRKHASKTHSKELNIQKVKEIYNKIYF